MYEVSEAFHRQYADMYDKFVRIHFKDGSVRTGLFKATPHNTNPTKENILGAEQGQGCPLKVIARTN